MQIVGIGFQITEGLETDLEKFAKKYKDFTGETATHVSLPMTSVFAKLDKFHGFEVANHQAQPGHIVVGSPI